MRRLLLTALIFSLGATETDARRGKGRGAKGQGRGARRDSAKPPPLEGPKADAFTAAVDVQALAPGDELSCHARDGFDIAGDAAFVWGLSFHVASAAECCRACSLHQRACGSARSAEIKHPPFWKAGEKGERRCGRRGRVCNAWIFCGGKRCFSYDVHNHSYGECWLKHEPNEASPIAVGPTLPKVMREAPRKLWPWAVAEKLWPGPPPERNSWQAGIVAPRKASVWESYHLPGWHNGFCEKHGPC